MRSYIYFDTDSLNSYWSQINAGLIRLTITEQQAENKRTGDDSQTFKTRLPCGELGMDAAVSGSTCCILERRRRCLEEKIIHDYLFDEVYRFLERNHAINSRAFQVGNFLSTTGPIVWLHERFENPNCGALFRGKRLLLIEDCIAILNENHMRNDPDTAAILFGGFVTLTGLATNAVSSSALSESPFAFILPKLDPQVQTLYVVHPLALYYAHHFSA